MKTLAQVRTEYIEDAAAEFLSVLTSRVEEGLKTEAEANLYRKRLPRAILLATTDHMILQTAQGVYDVWSTGKNMDQVYTVDTNKRTCSCPDADPERGGAPQGYCKHRLACFLTMRAERGLSVLGNRLEGLKLPHTHVYECGHPSLEACWDSGCVTVQEASVCDSCHSEEGTHSMDDNEYLRVPAHESECVPEGKLVPDAEPLMPLPTPLNPPEQYEVANPYTPPPPPLPEAPASLNLKVKHHNVEVMMTLRAHTDAEILERLPAVLEGLSKALGVKFTNE